MKSLREIALLLQMSLTSIRTRLGSYLVTVISITSVVGVLVSMLSMGTGVQALAVRSARADRALIESNGAQGPFQSNIAASAVSTLEDMPGIARGADGTPLATATSIVIATVHKRTDGSVVSIPLDAIDSRFFSVYPEVHITEGRMFHPGVYELIVQSARRAEFRDLNVGDHIHLRGVDWRIVGAYETVGGNWNGLMGDLDTVAPAYRRDTRQFVSLVLQPPVNASFASIAAVLKSNPAIDVQIHHEAQVLDEGSQALRGVLNFVSYFVGVVMGVGATLGAVNILYSIVDGRRREMATLRAIGFTSGAIVLSVLLESLLLAIPGALLGVLAAWLLFNGNEVSPAGASFQLLVSAHLALLGILWALVMGFIGGLLPALRVGRAPVHAGLRAV